MAIEFTKLYDPLLDWVYEQAGGNPLEGVDLGPFALEHGLTERQAFDLLYYGKSKGTVTDTFATLGVASANLTPQGIELMEERLRRRASPVARSTAARRALLLWLWTKKDEGARFPVVESFVGTPQATFEGVQLTAEEIDRAAGYLKSKELINGQGAWGRQGPVWAEITVKGQDCVENFDGDPSAHDRRGGGGNTYNTYLPNAQGVIVGEQQDFTQNNTTGIDPRAFVELAGYVGQISSTLSMSEPERVELERVAQDLHDEATSGAPQQSKLRQLASQVKERLLEASTTMAATVGIQMAERAIGTLTQ